ncbi:A-kinase anchor protein 10, mitochondrial [Cimex lectularius]|uniref:RGS domain-containing protein n=1 Tax=Cimex lectularius TaxID=79782 RepID=A0A8I6RJ64_CIMLE|nr:A-kinase anchor protein 10, mitochondrial [Cimex lectularius]
MLQFWKKGSSPKKIKNGCPQTADLDSDFSVRSGPLAKFKSEDSIGKQPCEKLSRLSLGLEDAIHNKTALSYLSQYMEVRGYSNLFNLLADLERLPFRLQPSPRSAHSPSGLSTDEANSVLSIRHIFDKYLNEESHCKVKMPDDIKLAVLSALSSDQTDVQISKLKNAVFYLIKKDIWNDFLKSDWHCKYQIEVMTSRSMTLSDVLYNDSCLGAFLDFLDSEGLSPVIEFWLSATSFEKQYKWENSPNSDSIQNDAIAIYEKYLSLQAMTPLGVCDQVRFAVEEGICRETQTSPECFWPAQVAVEDFLSQNCLKHFLSSQQYLALLSDVMATTCLTSLITKSNLSPASSITEGSQDFSKASQVDVEGLWRRRKHNCGLSFGRIDQLGRYETDIEPEPERKSESRITRVVKLLLNKDEQKAQEEMAWRVAEMIVKDITSITMGAPHSEDA